MNYDEYSQARAREVKRRAEANRAWLRAKIDGMGLRREINLGAILRAPQAVINIECQRMIEEAGLPW